MVAFSYCFPVYQTLAIVLEKKDVWIKRGTWLALGLIWEEPKSLAETKESHSRSMSLGGSQLIEDKFFELE